MTFCVFWKTVQKYTKKMNEPYKNREFLGFLSEYALCIPPKT
jgi:hypothetical protein